MGDNLSDIFKKSAEKPPRPGSDYNRQQARDLPISHPARVKKAIEVENELLLQHDIKDQLAAKKFRTDCTNLHRDYGGTMQECQTIVGRKNPRGFEVAKKVWEQARQGPYSQESTQSSHEQQGTTAPFSDFWTSSSGAGSSRGDVRPPRDDKDLYDFFNSHTSQKN